MKMSQLLLPLLYAIWVVGYAGSLCLHEFTFYRDTVDSLSFDAPTTYSIMFLFAPYLYNSIMSLITACGLLKVLHLLLILRSAELLRLPSNLAQGVTPIVSWSAALTSKLVLALSHGLAQLFSFAIGMCLLVLEIFKLLMGYYRQRNTDSGSAAKPNEELEKQNKLLNETVNSLTTNNEHMKLQLKRNADSEKKISDQLAQVRQELAKTKKGLAKTKEELARMERLHREIQELATEKCRQVDSFILLTRKLEKKIKQDSSDKVPATIPCSSVISKVEAVFEEEPEYDGSSEDQSKEEVFTGENKGQVIAPMPCLHHSEVSKNSSAGLDTAEEKKESVTPCSKSRKDAESLLGSDDKDQSFAKAFLKQSSTSNSTAPEAETKKEAVKQHVELSRSRSRSRSSSMSIELEPATENIVAAVPFRPTRTRMEGVFRTSATVFETDPVPKRNGELSGFEPATAAAITMGEAEPPIYPDFETMEEEMVEPAIMKMIEPSPGPVTITPRSASPTDDDHSMKGVQYLDESKDGQRQMQPEQQDADMPLAREAVDDTPEAREKLVHDGNILRQLLANQKKAREAAATAAADTIAETDLDEESEDDENGENNIDDDSEENNVNNDSGENNVNDNCNNIVQRVDFANLPPVNDSDSEEDRHFGRAVRSRAPPPPSPEAREEPNVPDQSPVTPPRPNSPAASTSFLEESDIVLEEIEFWELEDLVVKFVERKIDNRQAQIGDWGEAVDKRLRDIVVDMTCRLKSGDSRMPDFSYKAEKGKRRHLVGYVSIIRRKCDLMSDKTAECVAGLDDLLRLMSDEFGKYDGIKRQLLKRAKEEEVQAKQRGEPDDKNLILAINAYEHAHEHKLCEVQNFEGTCNVEGTLVGDLDTLTTLSILPPEVRQSVNKALATLKRRWEEHVAQPQIANRPKKAPKSRRQQ